MEVKLEAVNGGTQKVETVDLTHECSPDDMVPWNWPDEELPEGDWRKGCGDWRAPDGFECKFCGMVQVG